MKIEKIILKNIKSHYGIHEINFTNPAFDEGIFLICGRTGAGKSTILDAITLALYGTVQGVDITGSKNEIISDGTTDCFSEVTFSSKNTRYRTRFAQTKTRNNTLNKYTRELSIVSDDGAPDITIMSATNNTLFNNKIIEITNLDYNQFTKVVMLQQGEFSAFLKSDQDERAKILEKITGTNIYTSISVKAFEKTKQAKQNLDIVEAELKGITILDEDTIQNCLQEKEIKNHEKNAIDAKIEKLINDITLVEKIDNLKAKITELNTAQDQHELACRNFEPQKERLKLAQQANQVAHIYNNYKTSEADLNMQLKSLSELQNKLPIDEQALRLAQNEVAIAQSKLADCKLNEEESASIFKQVRSLQVELKSFKADLNNTKAMRDTVQNDLLSMKANLERHSQNVNDYTARLKNCECYFSDHAPDKDLLSEYAVIKNELNNLQLLSRDVSDAQTALDKAKSELNQANQRLCHDKNNIEISNLALNTAKQSYESAKQNYDSFCSTQNLETLEELKDSLYREMLFAREVKNYDDERKHLEDGKPCPLCGAIHEHPFALKTPEVDEIQIKFDNCENKIKTIRSMQADFEKAKTALDQTELEYQKLSCTLESSENDAKTKEQLVSEKNKNLESILARFQQRLTALNTEIEKYHVTITSISKADEVDQLLFKRKTQWQNLETKKNELQTQFQNAKSEESSLHIRIDELNKTLSQYSVDLKQKENAVLDIQSKITVLFGNKNVDEEENRIKAESNNAQIILDRNNETLVKAEKTLAATNSGVIERSKYVDAAKLRVEQCEIDFLAALANHNFKNESEFVSARIDDKAIAQLILEAEGLDNKSIDLAARKNEAQKDLDALIQSPIPTLPADDLRADYQHQKLLLNDITRSISQIEKTISDNEQNAELRKKHETIIKAAKTEHERWKKLSDLIGSSDGKQFRTFVQGLTFSILISNANHYLSNLMPRFDLMRDRENKDLNFYVLDKHTGDTRSSSTLSGGQRFCISLALALGLAEMTSANVEIESLFIDEGFGSLDDELLDEALEMMQNLSLSGRGKLIGLISHVAKAQEKITTKLEVLDIGAGRCRLVGPGCAERASDPPKPSSAKNKSNTNDPKPRKTRAKSDKN